MRPRQGLRHPSLDPSAVKRRPLLIKTRRDEGSVLIALSGELDTASAEELDGRIRDAEESDVVRIVVDLSGVSFIDSTGLNVLLQAKGRSDGRLRYIPSCHDSVTQLLQLTGTLGVFD